MKKQLILMITFFVVSFTQGQTSDKQLKTFVRDYTYRASDGDSKVSSRQQALKEVKALLIEELGTYVESYVNHEVEEKNGKITKDFFTNEIRSISVGTTETKILEEEWDGYTYYIRAKINADPEEVLRRINETLSTRKKSLVIDSLRTLLKYSDVELKNKANELEELENKLNTTNAKLNSQLKSYNDAKHELEALKAKLAKYQKVEQEIKNEIEAIRQKVLSQGSMARSFIKKGMTYEEIKRGLGEENNRNKIPSFTLNYRAKINLSVWKPNKTSLSVNFYALGDTWFCYDESGLVDGVWTHDKMQLIINADNINRFNLMKKYNISDSLY